MREALCLLPTRPNYVLQRGCPTIGLLRPGAHPPRTASYADHRKPRGSTPEEGGQYLCFNADGLGVDAVRRLSSRRITRGDLIRPPSAKRGGRPGEARGAPGRAAVRIGTWEGVPGEGRSRRRNRPGDSIGALPRNPTGTLETCRVCTLRRAFLFPPSCESCSDSSPRPAASGRGL